MAIVALIGRPNVGKSSLFNCLVGERRAIESAEPGTTRDRLIAHVNYHNHAFILVDAAGIIEQSKSTDQLFHQVQAQVKLARDEADLISFVYDVQDGLTAEDDRILDTCRKLAKPVILVANKADNLNLSRLVEQLGKLGFKDHLATSAIHRTGMSDLVEAILANLPGSPQMHHVSNEVPVAIVGRPNVGKSTLLNALANDVRSIVSDTPGTTRDIVDVVVPFRGEQFRFVDTAGIRRKGRVEEGIEYYAVVRAIKAMSEAKCAVLVLDAVEGISRGDARIAGLAVEAGCGLVIAVNKWDIKRSNILRETLQVNKSQISKKNFDDDELQREFIQKLQNQLKFALWAPVVFISAQEKINLTALCERIRKAVQARQTLIDQSRLNDLKEIMATRLPSLPKIYHLTQVDVSPPRFELDVNQPGKWHFSSLRFVENMIREIEPFLGTPIKIELTAYEKSNKV